jgi:hypothetical protein
VPASIAAAAAAAVSNKQNFIHVRGIKFRRF